MLSQKIVVTLLLFFNICYSVAQVDHLRTIEVYGYAEQEIVPDQILFEVTIEEFLEGRDKIPLAKLESQLFNLSDHLGINRDQVALFDNSMRNRPVRRRQEEILQSKSFLFTFSNIGQLDTFARLITNIPIDQAQIIQVTHSDLPEFEQNLKLQAIQNASVKASAMLNELSEELGPVQKIVEFGENGIAQILNQYTNYLENYYATVFRAQNGNLSPGNTQSIPYRKIRIKTSVEVVFAIE